MTLAVLSGVKGKWLAVVMVLVLAFAGWKVWRAPNEADPGITKKEKRAPVAVEINEIAVGPIELLRTFTGTLDAHSQFVVAPKINGRVEKLSVDIADPVTPGQVVVTLDSDEYVQAVERAKAELEVENASLNEARSLLKIAQRELTRLKRLSERGNVSESQLDAARSDELAKQAMVAVSQARIARAAADLASARIRLGYTQIRADWEGGDHNRVVAERFVDAGETVSANAPLLRIVELNPITAVFFVTERDYAYVKPGQTAELATDAYPQQRFQAKVVRVAPVFQTATRQARVELEVENPQQWLKPGMFVRATVRLDRIEDAVIIPTQALTKRNEEEGIFSIDDKKIAHWQAIQKGIQQGDKIQVLSPNITGKVVVLGQQQLKEGSRVRVVKK